MMRCRPLFLSAAFVCWIASAAAVCRAFVLGKNTPFSRPGHRPTVMRYSDSKQSDIDLSERTNETGQFRSLYPALRPYNNGTIAVDDIHRVFYQEYGQNASNKEALTALFLHGGPGAGCNPNHARFFDPNRYRIVLLDQRGCGQSTPRGEVTRNTLQYLVQDCETLRNELGIHQWDLILGGSWGTTLALAYGQSHADRVRSLVLRGVCLLRPSEVDWLFSSKGGAASLDPDGWKNFSSQVRVDDYEEQDDSGRAALHSHYDALLGNDPVTRIQAARSWMTWEMRVSSLGRRQNGMENTNVSYPVLVWTPADGWSFEDNQGKRLHNVTWYVSHMLRRGLDRQRDRLQVGDEPRPVLPIIACPSPAKASNESISREDAAKFVPAQAMLTCFYSVNERYATGNLDLLDRNRIDQLKSIRCIAVQGGKDTICPPDTALDLHEVWQEMELRIPSEAGHSMYDEAIMNELVRATDRLAKDLAAEKLS